VKITVNFEGPGAFHIYYGDETLGWHQSPHFRDEGCPLEPKPLRRRRPIHRQPIHPPFDRSMVLFHDAHRAIIIKTLRQTNWWNLDGTS